MFPQEPRHRPGQTSRQAASCSAHSAELGSVPCPTCPRPQSPDWAIPNLSGDPSQAHSDGQARACSSWPQLLLPCKRKTRGPPLPQAGSTAGGGREPVGVATFSHQDGHKPVGRAQAQQGSRRQRGWAWRGREQKLRNQRREGEGDGPPGQHGSDQTQGLSREVAGGTGVPVLGREARLLRYLHQPRSRDPRALGLRKQVGHAALMARAKRHLATLHHPHGTEAQAADPPSTPPGSARPVNVPPGDCISVTATGPSQGAPAQVCLQQPARGRATFKEQSRAGCPTGQRGRQGWGGELEGRVSQS